MTAYVMLKRKWANEPEPEAPRPTVPVSSRDGAPVLGVRGAVLLDRCPRGPGRG